MRNLLILKGKFISHLFSTLSLLFNTLFLTHSH